MSIIIKDVLFFDHANSDIEQNAVLNYLNVKWDIGLDEQETPLVYDCECHCFFEKELEINNK